jgi:hypothetical protein
VTRDRLNRCRQKYTTEEHLQESDRREGNSQAAKEAARHGHATRPAMPIFRL